MSRLNPTKLLTVLLIALVFSSLFGLILGAVNVPVLAFLEISSVSQTYQTILIHIRLPRVILAACIGALLAMSGAVMQGLFRNPLADPSLIGVTAGASMGGSLMIFFLSSFAPFVLALGGVYASLPLVSFGAILGGLVAVTIVYALANKQQGISVATMLLAGIAITTLAGSVTTLLEFMADNEMLRRISLWHMGGFEGANYQRVSIALLMLLLAAAYFPRCAQSLNILLLGESEARHLGIHVETLKRRLIVVVATCVGISVALAGTIAFVGLIVPHIIRLLIGPDHRYLLPASALTGALLLVVADLLARLILAPAELPVGLVTALIGVPFFISLLRRRYVYGLS